MALSYLRVLRAKRKYAPVVVVDHTISQVRELELKEAFNVTVVAGDIYRRLHGPPTERHDVILIDVDHNPEQPLHADNLTFYTRDGLTRAREHLTPGGILGVWSSAEDVAFVEALEQVFAEVHVEAVVWWNDLIDEEQRDDLFLDANTGCQHWTFNAVSEVRTGIAISNWDMDDPSPAPIAIFGDHVGNFYALNAITGELVWRSVVQWLCEGHLRGLKVGQEWWTSKRHLKTFLDHHANLPSRGADSSP